MSDTYNGWKNWDTWNVALWLQNDEGLYNIAKDCSSYAEVAERLNSLDCKETPDEVSYTSDHLDIKALDNMMRELQ